VRDRNAGTILSVAGVACLDPDFPGRMFDVQYTQRGEAGQLEEAFNQEGEAVIASFRFEPAPEDDDWSLAGGR
jgi:sporulation-control protein spo0M